MKTKKSNIDKITKLMENFSVRDLEKIKKEAENKISSSKASFESNAKNNLTF